MQTRIRSSNAPMQALLIKDDAAGPLRLANGSDSQRLQRHVNNLVSTVSASSHSKILFTTGIGLKSEEIPLRLPAVLLPALRAMEKMKELELPVPQYLVYQAVDFIAETNAVPIGTARIISQKMINYIRLYIDVVHPEVAEKVHLESKVNLLANQVERVAQEIRNSALELLGNDPQAVKRLAEYASRNSKVGDDSCYTYASANVLCNGAMPKEYPFPKFLESLDVLLPIGGRREVPFFELTREIALRSETPYSVIPLLTRIGELPTYYAYPSGDITNAKDCTEERIQELHGNIRNDFAALKEDVGSLDILKNIYSQVQ